jgi:hypothetical protein
MAVGNIESFNFPMGYKLLCLVLLLEMFVASTPILRATGLRGGVVGLAGPLVGVGVALFEVKPNKTLRLVRQTVTAPDGKYHFTNLVKRIFLSRKPQRK